LDERLTQIIAAQPGYRLVIIDHYRDTPSWSITPVTAWGLVRDDEHNLEDEPGHWEGVVALWPYEDVTFAALTWENGSETSSKVWVMLGPNDPDPSIEEITEEWRRRREAWQQELE
jgi:hypothetical protein